MLPRQANTSLTFVTGATQGGIQPRYEIFQLQQNEDQWNIFLLALQSFQQMDPSSELSWYQIGGIHGVPYIPYAGVGQCPGCPTTGYCTHSSTLFPNWHRSYVALFEQSLQLNALAVANQFSGDARSRYLQAATSLRMPFWDWALLPGAGQNPFPQMFTDETVTVTTPSGQATIHNPLHSYSFGSANHTFMKTAFTPDSDVTIRNPTFTLATRESLRTDLYALLTSAQGFNNFATQSLYKARDNPNSIEMLHDRVHVRTGGDMAYIPTAAFDPIFFLHHAAVDHAYALWQLANPEDFMTAWTEVGSTYTYTSGTVENAESALTPFRSNGKGGFWSPDAVRNTTIFNYVYADLEMGQSAAVIINTLYGDDNLTDTRAASMGIHKKTQPSHKEDHSRKKPHQQKSETRQEYIINIRADSMGAEGSFTVFFFDQEVRDDEVCSWHESEAVIASHSFFTGPGKKGDGTLLSSAGTSLTPGLRRAVKDGRLASLEEEDVVRYLRSTLRWRVKMQQGKAVDESEIPGLEIRVLMAEVRGPKALDEMPVWSPFRALEL
ncbi:hypothetical protein BDY17DRAFT_252127 [Neohortaea acidophila]|uniref:tyrosinase n=1 Tax=Neohortaea acidophila TaxID=245834 RepID=A0A6A6PR78_9PEZI|nr:uncharacterized protein BDY17DRAFT_252127 [Neohortaea acidophila]KAF2482306.1 hypothetical protein BDY17DRAFT_252127 [Neohortaea acidophila]